MEEYRSPEYWVKAWDRQARSNPSGRGRGYASRGTWDRMAPGYGGELDRPGRPDSLLRWIERQEIELPGLSVLDVGCGTGKHAIEFASRGALVTGVDFSKAMLDRLEMEAPAEAADRIDVVQADWESVDTAERGWVGAFDLVLANMTPAVRTPQAFLKLQRCSRQWCFFKSWMGRRTSPLRDRISKKLACRSDPREHWTLPLAFNLLCAQGRLPSVEFEDISWEWWEPLDQASAFFKEFFSGLSDLSPGEQARLIEEELAAVAKDGKVPRSMAGHVGIIAWKACEDGGAAPGPTA